MRRWVVVAAFLVMLGSASPALASIVNVGGGTWSYGTSTNWLVGKNVWSHYVHPNYYHSATAIGGPNNVKKYATANNWANADTSCMAWESAAEYWNTYPW